MKYKFLKITLLALCLGKVATLNAQQEQANFPSYQYPTWFDEAKLGIMIHYGLYSIPSYSDKEQYSEWFYKGLISDDTLRINFQKRVYGEDFQYFDYMKMFKAEMFDAQQWAELFKNSGAKYIVFTTKHHDGFCLYPSKYTDLNVMNTPCKRDIVGELAEAVRERGLRLGLYYSLTEWTNPLYRWTIDKDGIDTYVEKHMLPQFKEIVDLYHPSYLFSDGDWDFSAKTFRSQEMVEYLMEKVGKDEVVVNNRWGNGFGFGHKTPEYSSGIIESNVPWSECRSLSRSFALNRKSNLEDYMSPEDLIYHFVQLVSMGGGLMLNVSPAADGQIPLLQQERLMQMGRWLQVNGEAIYGSKPWLKSFDSRDKTANIEENNIDFDWVRNAPIDGASEDGFSITWQGEFSVDKTDKYTFTLEADDSARFTLMQGENALLDLKSEKAAVEKTIKLKKGETYLVKLNYSEIDVDAHCYLHYRQGNQNQQIMQIGDKGQGKVYWSEPYVFFTQNHGNVYAITPYKLGKEFSIKLDTTPSKNMAVSLLGNEDNTLPWKYENGFLIIDLSSLTPADIRGEYAWVFKLHNL